MGNLVRHVSTHYMFIDGAYLSKRVEALARIFGSAPKLDYRKIKSELGNVTSTNRGLITRVFYYDCLNDVRSSNESEEAFDGRVKSQEQFFDELRAIEGFHVREGSVSGHGKKLRQKKVDVLLAVEMLTHAVRGNMDVAHLLAGDLDFKPVVDALVQYGTYVIVHAQPRHCARELRNAADHYYPLTVGTYYSWAYEEYRQENPIPQREQSRAMPDNFEVSARGFYKDMPITFGRRSGETVTRLLVGGPDQPGGFQLSHVDPKLLKEYFDQQYGEWGELTWDQ